MKKARVYLVRGLLLTFCALLIAVGIALGNAKIELTESGAHKRLLVPIGTAAVGLNTFAGTGDQVRVPGFLDGPVVRRDADSSWTATWFCEDRV
ncbi:hypothetical protein DVK02_18755, partial [Halobellus sp. Atlit-31R]